MAPQAPIFSPEHPDYVLQGRNRPRLRHALTGVVLATTFTLAGFATRGDAQQVTSAQNQNAAPVTGHAQVIAQAIFDLPDGSLTWSVATLEADEQASGLGTEGASGFVLADDGAVVIRDGANARTRLVGGEALVVRPDDNLTVRAPGAGPASVSLLTLAPAEQRDLGDAIQAGEAFTSPGGSRDVELVGDVLSEGETATIPAAAAPIFVLVTEGAIAIAMGDDETRMVRAGETTLVPGDLVVTGAAEEPARFAAAVISADVDPESAEVDAATPATTPTTSRPRPTTPAVSPRPRPSPTPSASPSPSPSPSTSPTPGGNGAQDDPDSDGLVNEREDALGTDRRDPDTDYDLLTDGEEAHTYLSNPTVRDTEGDGLYDGDEVIRVGTDPVVKDTDADGLDDGAEANEFLTNPLDDDTDHDDFGDYNEILRGTDPRVVDTDGDGVADGVEVTQYHTNPLVYDTDGDGYSDGDEIYYYGTNPNDPDTDRDGLKEAEEFFLGTNPKVADTDGDGYSDGAEVYEHRTWPTDPESHP